MLEIVAASEVGRHVIELLKPFEANVPCLILCFRRGGSRNGVKKVSLEELARDSDVISLHAPSLSTTNGMINRGNHAVDER